MFIRILLALAVAATISFLLAFSAIEKGRFSTRNRALAFPLLAILLGSAALIRASQSNPADAYGLFWKIIGGILLALAVKLLWELRKVRTRQG